MSLPRDSFQAVIQDNLVATWRQFIDRMKESLDILEKEIDEASEMRSICTSEWCEATEHVIDEISNSLFSISEPRWVSEDDSKKVRQLKRRLHDLYAKYKSTTG